MIFFSFYLLVGLHLMDPPQVIRVEAEVNMENVDFNHFNPSPSRPRPTTSSVSIYSVQCSKCFKWRVMPTQEEYEEIRKNLKDNPYYCNRKPYASCEDPADLEYNDARIWIIDKSNIPKTPNGCKRKVVVRSDYSKCDVYYQMPTGKKVRTLNEVEQFLETNPTYKSVLNVSDFNFYTPRVMKDTVPTDLEAEASKEKLTVTDT